MVPNVGNVKSLARNVTLLVRSVQYVPTIHFYMVDFVEMNVLCHYMVNHLLNLVFHHVEVKSYGINIALIIAQMALFFISLAQVIEANNHVSIPALKVIIETLKLKLVI